MGAVLPRRAVERNTLRDVGAQTERLAERQADSVRPACQLLGGAQRFLDRQDQQLTCDRVGALGAYLTEEQQAALRRGRPVDGTITIDGQRYLLSARLVKNGRAFVVLRPASTVSSAWLPQFEAL